MNPANIWITFPELLIWFPLLTGVITLFIKNNKGVKAWTLVSTVITLLLSLTSIYFSSQKYFLLNNVSYYWLEYIGASFSVGLDGMARILTLLTAVSFPIIFIATYKNEYKNSNVYYALMLLTQAGLMGVFVATDALVFYFFWELALIPVYFLCSRWGGEKRIQATFKFFVYTFLGSLLMLIGIICVYQHTGATDYSAHSFAIQAFYRVKLSVVEQNCIFWLFFIAFAIKMPIFPFHTWQPDAYEQSPTSTTMVLSGIMVKMGLYGALRWLLPIFPAASIKFSSIIIFLSVAGMIYASCIAIVQDDLKRFAAYSSIAHIGLMCAAIFSHTEIGMEGVMIQMFSHGINIIALWIVIDLIEKQTGVRKISQLSGVAHQMPVLTILLVVIAFANIALPLTNAFVGEFMMFSGLFKFSMWYAAVAGLSIILAAVYTLNMVQKVFYGVTNSLTATIKEISWNEKLILSVIVILVIATGVFPQPLFDLTKDTVAALVTTFK
ncbi:MAG TPA: NADH-quinone oxidoreductase subunit M [Ferruginibacter sp.]|jgi:NADH-quinone oxidoreductase subunit M|nr:NADH-quinone oxidoreductase subunit M [Ferruginibacter sp.]